MSGNAARRAAVQSSSSTPCRRWVRPSAAAPALPAGPQEATAEPAHRHAWRGRPKAKKLRRCRRLSRLPQGRSWSAAEAGDRGPPSQAAAHASGHGLLHGCGIARCAVLPRSARRHRRRTHHDWRGRRARRGSCARSPPMQPKGRLARCRAVIAAPHRVADSNPAAGRSLPKFNGYGAANRVKRSFEIGTSV